MNFITSDCCNYSAYNNKNLEALVFFVLPQSGEIVTPCGEIVKYTFRNKRGMPYK